ncbi:MAG: class I SAM-dependent methyltransferase [Nanoarchaeota archaeon]
MSDKDTVDYLYAAKGRGLQDLATRLDLNTRLGNFDLSNTIRRRLSLQDGMSLLDVGCGTGKHLSEFRRQTRITVYGVDPSSQKLVDDEIFFQRARAEELPFRDGVFDRATCNYAMYYTNRWQEACNEMMRVTKDGGLIVISGPGIGNNSEFYGLHRELFGDISDIDKIGLEFLDQKLIPYLVAQGVTFMAELRGNRVVYPTAEDFIKYYTSTSLFRMTSRELDPTQMVGTIRRHLSPIYEEGKQFENIKRVRIVTIIKD